MASGREPDILIVDDNPVNLDLLSRVLSADGYRVRPAPSGKLALRAAANQPPDLVMLDINMPEMNGFEVCRLLKEDPALRSIPVIFISALTEILDKVRAFDAGGVDYVTKPFETKEVLARVRVHCDLRRVQSELHDKNIALEKALSDLKNAQVQLVQAEKMASLGVLTAGLAHEINNPINFVNSGVKGLFKVQADLNRLLDAYDALDWKGQEGVARIMELKQEIDYDDARHALDELASSILSGVTRTVRIVEGLRIFSRSDTQGKKLAQVHECLDSALMLLQVRAGGGIRIDRDYGELPMVLCYPGQINQVFMNILSNAIDAVEEKHEKGGGVISIRTGMQDRGGRKGVCVAISNSGSAIPEEDITHLFEPFYTTKEVGKGVGLGLSITHGIINDHGGEIDVTSDEEKGTTFRVWLPVQTNDSIKGGDA